MDEFSFSVLARDIAPMLDGPFAAGVVHPYGWSAVLWDNGIKPIPCVLGLGRTLKFLSPFPLQSDTALDLRQRDALGVIHDRLRRLTVAVVGCGGTGSPFAEQLVRMGVACVILVDQKRLETPSNVRRVFGSKAADLRKPRPKVDIVGDHLEELGLETRIKRISGDVRSEAVVRELLDADVVINATDTHGSRAAVNELVGTYLLPVIDLGVRVGTKTNNLLTGLAAEVRILTPTTPCLWCRKTIDADVIRAENLPEEERQRQEQEGYVVRGIGDPVPSVIALTVLGSGLATCALLGLLAEEGDVIPHGYVVDGFFGDAHQTKPAEPVTGCRCRKQIGVGDPAISRFSRSGESVSSC